MSAMLSLLVILILSSECCSGDRIDAFFRCIVSTKLPSFNTSQPACPISTEDLLALPDTYGSCSDIHLFADYIENNKVELEFIPTLILDEAIYQSIEMTTEYCWDEVNEYLCSTYDLCAETTVKEACQMEIFRLFAYTSKNHFNYLLYTYLAAYQMHMFLWDFLSTTGDTASTQHFLYTCTSNDLGNVDDCVSDLLGQCFELESLYYDDPYWCYFWVQNRLCYQFKGDDRFRCVWIMDLLSWASLEDQCATEDNEGKCEVLLNDVLKKPVNQVNSSDIDQVKSVLSGGSKRSNHTSKTLNQLNTIINFFNQNETNIAQLIDTQDADAFLSVVNVLASEERLSVLKNESTNNSGIILLQDLEQLSKLIAIAVAEGNARVNPKYAYNGNNIGVFLSAGSLEQNYSSGELILYNNTTTKSNMSVSINIPSQASCDDLIMSGSADYDYYFYDYEDVCDGKAYCEIYDYSTGEWIPYYDLSILFGDCSKKLRLREDCKSVVATSITGNMDDFLSNNTSENMTLVSLILSSQLITGSDDTDQATLHFLHKNATLNFTLSSPVNLTEYTPKCCYLIPQTMEWSDEGIETIVLSETEVECITNHLSSFAVLVDHRGLLETEQIPSKERLALNIIGYIGPALSLISLIVAVVLMIMLRKKLQKGALYFIHLNLSISLMLALIVFIVGLETANDIKWLCSLVAGLLHYLFLCVFFWMLIEGITLCVMVMYVWGTKYLKWYLFLPLGWGVPVIIVAISVGIRYELYGTDNFCWLSYEAGLQWAFLGPVVVICMINTVILILTIVKVALLMRHKLKNHHKSKNFQIVKSSILGAIILFPLLGVTWIIGIFAVSAKTTVFLWLFTICNSLQGVGILVLHVLKNKVVLMWFTKKCPCLKKYTSHKSVSTFSSTRKLTKETSVQSVEVNGNDNTSIEVIGMKTIQEE